MGKKGRPKKPPFPSSFGVPPILPEGMEPITYPKKLHNKKGWDTSGKYDTKNHPGRLPTLWFNDDPDARIRAQDRMRKTQAIGTTEAKTGLGDSANSIRHSNVVKRRDYLENTYEDLIKRTPSNSSCANIIHKKDKSDMVLSVTKGKDPTQTLRKDIAIIKTKNSW